MGRGILMTEKIKPEKPSSFESSVGNSSIEQIGLSLYLHIPFCKTKCSYCDFNTYQGIEDLIPAFVNALCLDIQRWLTSLQNPKINTIFFGGGTPSLLDSHSIGKILKTIQKYSYLSDDIEITLESNPDDLHLEKCQELFNSGINRLSIGVQSLKDNLLTTLSRRHNSSTAISAISNAQNSGFNNISVDLMYGLPGQTIQDWDETLSQILATNIQHISMYSLTIEEGTPFYSMYAKGVISLPPDDIVADMYQIAQSHLINNGFEHYEISNWAKNHNYSRHNLAYWQRKPYIGLGPGAHSNIGNARFWAIKSPKKYVQESLLHGTGTSNHAQHAINEKFLSDHNLIDGFEILTKEQISSELMFLGLRLLNGIHTRVYHTIFGIDLKSIYKSQLKTLVESQLIENSESQIKLSPSKIFVSNGIFEEFL
jgi:oxygen-independent coproporphyrinogen III oxidase